MRPPGRVSRSSIGSEAWNARSSPWSPRIREQVGRRALALRGDDDPVAVGQQRAQLVDDGLGVARCRRPPPRRDGRRVGRVGRGRHRPGRAVHAGQQALGRQVEPREGRDVAGLPRPGQRRGEVGLLGQHVGSPVPEALGLDEDHLGLGRQPVGQQLLAVHQPGQPALHPVEGQALGQALPLLAPPWLGRDQELRAPPDLRRRLQLAGGHDHGLVDRIGRALVVDRELGQPVDLVAPEVDPDGGVRGRREHVDDRPSSGHLAAVLDQLLSAVPGRDQAGQQHLGVERLPGPDDLGLDAFGVRAEALEQRPDAGDDDPGPAGRGVVLEAPQHAEAPAHRLDARADPLEGQRLPRREELDVLRGQELLQVVGQALARRSRSARRRAGCPPRDPRQPGEGERRAASGTARTADRRPRTAASAGSSRRRAGSDWRLIAGQSTVPSPACPSSPHLRAGSLRDGVAPAALGDQHDADQDEQGAHHEQAGAGARRRQGA